MLYLRDYELYKCPKLGQKIGMGLYLYLCQVPSLTSIQKFTIIKKYVESISKSLIELPK